MRSRSPADRRRRPPSSAFVVLGAGLLALAAARLLHPSGSSEQAPQTREIVHVRARPEAAPTPPAVLRYQLSQGETLSQVWERSGRPRAELDAVARAASSVFDVRRLRVGTPIEIYPEGQRSSATARSGSALDSVIVRIDADRRLAVRGEGGGMLMAELHETPVREVQRTHVGCIEHSLAAALQDESGDFSLLALELDGIYGGQIDFYSDLQPGDCISLTFRTFVRPDGSFRLGRIESAEFVNQGKRYPAVYFEAPDGTADYYDLAGRSLKRQFLRSPLKFTRISSGFTLRRYHPILRRYRAHPGIDYAAPSGTPVQAAGSGVVAFAGWKRGYGKVVEIRHGKVYETSYAHLSRIARGIRSGERVSQGKVIGYVGSTGLSTGPHLDYRFSKNGTFVNPLNEKFVSGDPVAPRYRGLFEDRRDGATRTLADAYRSVLVEGLPIPDYLASSEGAAPGSLLAKGNPAQASFGDD